MDVLRILFCAALVIVFITLNPAGGVAQENRYCDQFGGSSASAKIAACIADLPSTGGIADARNSNRITPLPELWDSDPCAGVSKPVTILLGAYTLITSASTN